jgi:hypothetical protein
MLLPITSIPIRQNKNIAILSPSVVILSFQIETRTGPPYENRLIMKVKASKIKMNRNPLIIWKTGTFEKPIEIARNAKFTPSIIKLFDKKIETI